MPGQMLLKLERCVSSKIWPSCVYQFTSFGLQNANKMSTFPPLHILCAARKCKNLNGNKKMANTKYAFGLGPHILRSFTFCPTKISNFPSAHTCGACRLQLKENLRKIRFDSNGCHFKSKSLQCALYTAPHFASDKFLLRLNMVWRICVPTTIFCLLLLRMSTTFRA